MISRRAKKHLDLDTGVMKNALNKRLKEEERAVKRRFNVFLGRVNEYAVKWAPYDTGHLRNSSYFNLRKVKNILKGRIGFTAVYAIFVHRKHRTRSKFLEKAYNYVLKKEFIKILRGY